MKSWSQKSLTLEKAGLQHTTERSVKSLIILKTTVRTFDNVLRF